jgi:hypothetical protein
MSFDEVAAAGRGFRKETRAYHNRIAYVTRPSKRSYGSRNGKRRHTLGYGPLYDDTPREPLLRAQLFIQPLSEGAKVGTGLSKSRVFLEQLVDRLAAMLVRLI